MASKHPWSKFYWADYDADEGLRICSLAAQGLWMRMLCIMARSTPVGELRIGTEPCTVSDLARAVGESKETVGEMLDELHRRGVFSVTRMGVIYNRRMRNAEIISRKRAEAGEKGARVTNGRLWNKQVLPRQNSGNGVSKNAAPYARSQKLEERKREDTVPLRGPAASNGKYAFQHGCVRLSEPDLHKWQKAFPHIAVEARLIAAEPWLAKESQWFHAAAGMLSKEEQRAILEIEKAKTVPTEQPADPKRFRSF